MPRDKLQQSRYVEHGQRPNVKLETPLDWAHGSEISSKIGDVEPCIDGYTRKHSLKRIREGTTIQWSLVWLCGSCAQPRNEGASGRIAHVQQPLWHRRVAQVDTSKPFIVVCYNSRVAIGPSHEQRRGKSRRSTIFESIKAVKSLDQRWSGLMIKTHLKIMQSLQFTILQAKIK